MDCVNLAQDTRNVTECPIGVPVVGKSKEVQVLLSTEDEDPKQGKLK